MVPFTLRQLEIFREIARRGNITSAAESLGITQSAASMALAELERVMGAPLFHRTGRGVAVNDRGRGILEKSAELFECVDAISETGGTTAEKVAGRIMLGCSTTIAGYVLPARLGELLSSHPGVEACLRVSNTEGVLRMVRNGEVDLGLIEGEVDARGLERREWTGDEIVAVTYPGDPHARSTRGITAAILAKKRWLMRESGSGTFDTVIEELRRHGIRPESELTFGNTESIKRGVEAGLGSAWLPLPSVERELAAGSLVRLRTALTIRRRYAMLLLPARRRGALLRATLAWLETPVVRK